MIRLTQRDHHVWVNPSWIKRVEADREIRQKWEGNKFVGMADPSGSLVHIFSEKWPIRVDEDPEAVVQMLEAAHRGS